MICSERKTTREEGDYNACENRLILEILRGLTHSHVTWEGELVTRCRVR